MSLTLTPTQAPLHRGYKRTAVGVIPEDWTIRSLLSCLRSAPNYGINAAAIPFDDTLPTYLRITDIGEDNQFRPSPRVSVRHPSVQTFFLNKGDLVFARTGASVGKSYLYNPNDGPLVFAGFLIRVSPNPGSLNQTSLHTAFSPNVTGIGSQQCQSEAASPESMDRNTERFSSRCLDPPNSAPSRRH